MNFVEDEFYVVETVDGAAGHFVGQFIADHPVLSLCFFVHGQKIDGIWVSSENREGVDGFLMACARPSVIKSAKHVVRAHPSRMPNRGDFPISLFDIGWVVDDVV